MRVFIGIAIRVMHPVHNGIRPWNKKRRSLRAPGKQVKQSLPFFTGYIMPVRSIPVQEEGMKEQGKKPVHEKKNNNNHKSDS
jgi:hypothetical protein